MSAFGAMHPQWCLPHKKKNTKLLGVTKFGRNALNEIVAYNMVMGCTKMIKFSKCAHNLKISLVLSKEFIHL